MSHWKRFLLICSAFLAIALLCRAQTDRATLEGTATDPSGAIISGARVKILAVETGLTEERTTNSNGHYRFPAIAIGNYTVSASNSGFKTKVIEQVVVQVGQTRTLDIQLEIGEASVKIDVMADAGPAERSSAEQATVIRADQIANLPVNGRDWAGLTLLAPFAQDDGGGDQRTIRFAGRARDDNNFSFDGVDAGGIQEQAQKSQVRLQISEDAIAEYRVNSALYTAEYGTQAGGQIDVVTKSGTNNLHGTAFGYLRNSVFDARNFNDFDLNGNPAIPPFRMGQYGMTIGGPIVKDRTFFFLSYEGLRQFTATTSQVAVPSPLLLKDILANGRGGAGPSPQMCSILQAFPWRATVGTIGTCAPRFSFSDGSFQIDPNSGDDEVFTNNPATTVHEDTWLVRIDQRFSDKTTLYGRAQRDISLVDAPNGPLDRVQTINHPANYFLALQHVFSTSLFNEAKVFVNRAPFHNPQASALPYSVDTSKIFQTINNNQADIEVGTTYGWIDNLTWTRGRHTFKSGMEIRRIRLNQGKTASNTLQFADIPSMISATLSNITFNSSWCCRKYRRTFVMPYFQDEWKVTPTFTANLGIRWEYYGVAHEADNRTTVFDLNQFHGVCLGSRSQNTPFPTPINTPACPRNPSLYEPNYRNFDPRVSIAWAPRSMHGKTVLRSGFGIYHGAAQNDDLNAGLESDTFIQKVTGSIPLDPIYQREVPDLSAFTSANGGSVAGRTPRGLQRQGRRDLYVETWGLTIEQQLPANFLFSTSYLGSHGVRLFSRGAVNLCTSLPDSNLNCIRTLDQFYPVTTQNPNGDPFQSVDFKSDVGTSSYHALQVALERRFTNGFSFQTRYAFGHSINDGSVGGGESNGPENVNCRQCDKGPSVFDVRHNFTANAVYELPFGPGKAHLANPGLLGKIAGGWSLSGIGLWHTGHPLTVVMNLQSFLLPDGNDQTTQRPDIVPGVPLYLPGGGHAGVPLINPAAFQTPPLSTNPNAVPGSLARFGNAGNGLIRALSSWQVDLALTKETKLTERFGLEFGVQAFNIFNHTQLGDPAVLSFTYDPTLPPAQAFSPDPLFGVINKTVNFNNNNDNQASPNTGTGLPRQLQFMLRLTF
jgi:hypothetical protein